jgi:hypothetical protein
VLRKKLGVLQAAAMMLCMAPSPALADRGGPPHGGSCGTRKDFSAALRADVSTKVVPRPGAGEASELHPENCPGND